MFNQMKYVLGVLLSFCMVSDSFAIGGSFIGNEAPSARAAGQGYVGIAGQNNDPTAVYVNPAAMTSLKGTQATVGIQWENIHGGFKDNAGNETKERVTNIGVPNLSVTQSFLDGKLSAGLSAQSPFGLETHWDGNSPMRYVATNSRLGIVEIMPAVAYQVHSMVSIGAGVDYVNLFNAQLDRHVNVNVVNSQLPPVFGPSIPGSADAVADLRGQATSWGYHTGVLFQPTERHALGVTYHSKVDLRVKGHTSLTGMSGGMAGLFGGPNFETSAFTDLVLPQNVQFGYAFKPNDKWILEADTAWFHWSSGQDINVRYPAINATTPQGQTQLAVLNAGNPTLLHSRDAWSAAAGVNYKVSDRWQVRSGFWYEPWALPESTFSPAFVDLSRYGVSAGAGYALTESLTIDAAYTALFFHSRTISNNVQVNTSGIPDGAGGTGTNGTYTDFANLVELNFTYRFGAGTH